MPRVFYNFLENSSRHWGPLLTEIRLFTHMEDDSLHLIYLDSGIGIPFEEKHQIFELKQGSGTGMGLFVIRESMGFTCITITENGTPGKCARVEIIVPKEKVRLKG
ncbi:MAG: sensor histidine kinase [Methanomicrobiales archaeon]